MRIPVVSGAFAGWRSRPSNTATVVSVTRPTREVEPSHTATSSSSSSDASDSTSSSNTSSLVRASVHASAHSSTHTSSLRGVAALIARPLSWSRPLLAPQQVASASGTFAVPEAKPTRADQAALRRTVWGLAAPAIGEQLLALGVGVSDTFLSGHLSARASALLGYGQATAVAAVGAAGMITWMALTAFFSVNVGVTALVARATGARDADLARRATAQGALLGLLAGTILLALSAPLAGVVTAALGVNGQVATLTAAFIRVWSLGLPLTGVASACTAAMRGAGDTRRPVIVMLAVNGINIAASWLLLNGSPRIGLAPIGVIGSACGAALGWMLGALLALTLLWRAHHKAPTLNLAAFRPRRDILWRILYVGLPSAAELLVFQLGVLGFSRQVISLGPTAYAANVTINTVESLGTLPAVGFGVAATALVGQSLGAGTPQRAAQATIEALRPCLALMLALGALAALAPQLLLGLFIADPAVFTAGDLAMRLSLLILPATGVSFVINGALRGAGDTKFPLVIRTIGPWGVRVPLALLLIPLLGLPGGRLAMALDYWTQLGLGMWRFRSGRWRKSKV